MANIIDHYFISVLAIGISSFEKCLFFFEAGYCYITQVDIKLAGLKLVILQTQPPSARSSGMHCYVQLHLPIFKLDYLGGCC
jgi:hypothetical protein